jgi:hypothetical protein
MCFKGLRTTNVRCVSCVLVGAVTIVGQPIAISDALLCNTPQSRGETEDLRIVDVLAEILPMNPRTVCS